MGDDAALTELAGVAELQTESAHAWALDYDDYEVASRRFTPRRITEAALAGSLVLVAAAGVVAVLGIRGVWHVELVELAAPTTAVPVPTTTVRAPPPPVTVTTVIVTEPAPAAQPSMRADDAFFIELLAKDGLKPADPRSAIAAGVAKCWEIENGATRGRAVLNATDAGMTYDDAVKFTADAIMAYCPHAGLP